MPPPPNCLPPGLGHAFAAVLLLATVVNPAHAQLRHYRLDPVHTRVAFQVSHAGFSRPLGTFAKVSGTLDFDASDFSTAHVEVDVPIATLNLGDADWQGKILDRTFFDASKYPTARFVSTKAERVDDTHLRVNGDLTLHGQTRPLLLDVTFNQLKRHPLTFRRTAGFSATGKLSRKAFGMDSWERLVGDEVTLVIEAEAQLEGQVEGGKDANDDGKQP